VDRYALSALSKKGARRLIIRPANPSDVEAIVKVQVDTWRSTYKGIMSDDFLAALSYERGARAWRNLFADVKPNQFACVAEHVDKEVIGFALGGQERHGDPEYTGELYAIYVLEAFQRRGLGRRLTATVAQNCIDAGLESFLVWVREANPFRGFYETLGGERLRDQQVNIGGAQLVEVAYGWRDARALLGKPTGTCND
jgi:ribosomal protein S18 acetylase RimI-like enzyme